MSVSPCMSESVYYKNNAKRGNIKTKATISMILKLSNNELEKEERQRKLAITCVMSSQ